MANILDSIKIKNSATVGDLLGIGTLNPGARLHVYNGSAGSYTLNTSHDDLVVENSVNTGIQLISPNTSYQYIAFGDPDSVNAGYIRYYHANNNMVFRTNGGDRMTINSSGNVGINDTNPSFKLTINSGGVSGGFKLYGSNSSYTGMFIGNTSTGAARIYMDASNGDFIGSDYSWIGQNNDLTFEIATSPSAGDILIKPNDTERVRVKTDGDIRLSNQQNGVSRLELYQNRQDVSNIGVWTIAAYNSVEVANLSFFRGSGGSSGYAKIFTKKNNASSLEEVVQFGTNDALTSTFRGNLIVDSGNVGIGTTSPSNLLHVQKDQDAETATEIMNNNTTGSSAAAALHLSVGNPVSSDPRITMNVGDGGLDWVMGVDNSDGDKFKISGGTDSHKPQLGTNDRLTIDSSGTVTASAFVGDGSGLTNLPASSGNITIPETITHVGDTDTYISFNNDVISLICGGVTMVQATENAVGNDVVAFGGQISYGSFLGSSSGYAHLQRGLFIQWGSFYSNTDATQIIYFPTTFTTTYAVFTSLANSTMSFSTSLFAIDRLNDLGDSTHYFFAIGTK